MQQALAAQSTLADQYGVQAELFSAPSFQLLRNEAMEAEHWNMRNPLAEPRTPLVTSILADAATAGPVVAVSDWIRSWPDMVSRWVPTPAWRSLGTDGFGRSDTREGLRAFFGVDADHVVVAVLAELARLGTIEREVVAAAIDGLGIDPQARFALGA